MPEKTFRYYVVYTYDHGGKGCFLLEMDGPLETYDQIVELAARIAAERSHSAVVISDWKRLQ